MEKMKTFLCVKLGIYIRQFASVTVRETQYPYPNGAPVASANCETSQGGFVCNALLLDFTDKKFNVALINKHRI